MLTPEGQSGDNTDKVMLLKMWADTLEQEARYSKAKPFIFAGMGKPTFPVSLHMVEMYLAYWQAIKKLIKKALKALKDEGKESALSVAIDYGDGRGDVNPRKVMAEAMTNWYNSPISPNEVLFTVGGAGALHTIFNTFNELNKDLFQYRVITPFPHYSLYAANEKHILHPIDVMKQPGYQLTAAALEESIKSAYELAKKDNNLPKMVILCNPSNPMGTIIPAEELKKIAKVLRKYPDLNIVIDEAYAEMCWSCSKPPSFLELTPDLRERMIILRSATKALSAAGERLGMLMAFDEKLMGALRDQNIKAIGHAPRSAQIAYAYTMLNFTDKEKEELEEFYKPKVDYVYQRAQQMGAAMPDPAYKVDGTFYVLCDLSDLLGEEIPLQAKRALGKTGKIQNSEDLVYSLLFQDSLMVAPGSYFGMSPNNGFIRITCSGTSEQLKEMMDRIEQRLLTARQNKSKRLVSEIELQLSKLEGSPGKQKRLDRLLQIKGINDLKVRNSALEKLLNQVTIKVNRTTAEGRAHAKQRCLAFFTKAQEEAHQQPEKVDLKAEWLRFVEKTTTEGILRNFLLNLPENQKQTHLPWVDHLQSLKTPNVSKEIPGEDMSEMVSKMKVA